MTARRTALRIALAVAVVVAAALAGGYFWLRGSLPQISGELALPGLDGPVQIVRDIHGIPFIRADSDHDAYFALGFVHAQDRLWQMDLMRRAGAGRLAEVVGPAALQSDEFMRVLGLYRLAQEDAKRLTGKARAAFEAYAEGVNAYIDHHKGAWPLEYYLLRTRPWHWTVADSLVWGRLMALRLSTDFREELYRARLLTRLTPEQVRDLWPTYEAGWREGADILPPQSASAVMGFPWTALAAAIPQSRPQPSASNSWIVDGKQSVSGKPELANDPHLHLDAPGTWYLARLDAPGLTLAGATSPGVPLLIVGHNDAVAWGFTSSYFDSQDLFVERVDDSDSGRYLTPEGSEPFVSHIETIKVRGAPDVSLTVRATRHGPVISDVMPAAKQVPVPAKGQYVVALADAGLTADDHTAEALFKVNFAKSTDDVVAALAGFDTPPQNVTFADREGNIGFYSVGRVPTRRQPDGLFPVPGWSGDYDWTGFIPFDRMPHALNPASGRIIAANNRITDGDDARRLSAYWPSPYRARRIAQLLDDMAPMTPAETAATQLDTVSLAARDLLPRLLAAPAAGKRDREAHRMLAAWDGNMRRNRAEPLIYSAWMLELGRALTAARLGPFADSFGPVDPMIIDHMLKHATAWCDDPATAAVETCNDAISVALDRAVKSLTRRYGEDMSRWKWGAAHVARFHNPILSRTPLAKYLARIEIPTSGDDTTVDRGTYDDSDPRDPFIQVHGAGFRGVYDLADLDSSLFMAAPGQSGNVLSRHYRDLARPWRDGQYVLMPGSGAADVAGTLSLRPE